MQQTCTGCSVSKPLEAFSRRQKTPNGRQFRCKECVNAYQKTYRESAENAEAKRQYHKKYRKDNAEDLKAKAAARNYDISVDEFKRLQDSQKGRCAICGTTPNGVGRSAGSLHVDHCHTSGKVRGLLCLSCNHGLGKFRDDVDLLAAAIEYLKIRRR